MMMSYRVRWSLFLAGVAVMLLAPARAQTLVDESGQARAEIIVPAGADPAEAFAAAELQRWIDRITGAVLPIRSEAVRSSRFPAKIHLGAAAAAEFADDLQFLAGHDGFAVRSRKEELWIFGSCAKGTLNGVYAFLEKNSDIIWARGQEAGVIYSPQSSFVVQQSNWREKPAFSLRGWWICNTHYHEQTEYWNARMACNFNPCNFFGNDFIYRRSLDCGMQIDPGGGHNLHRFMPADKYFSSHPEYFCQIDGKRRPEVSKNQICFSNLESVPAFVAEAAAQIRQSPFRVDTFSIKTEDNWNLCECEACRRDLTLPGGKVSRLDDDNFRSNQSWIYFNAVAAGLKALFPVLRLNCYAYIFTAPSPDIPIADNINVIFCPFVKNDKFSVLHESNSKWKERIDAWAKVSRNVVWREYYGCASGFPRPLADVAAVDLRYIHGELGLHQVYSEYVPDWNSRNNRDADRWDVSAMEFWVLSKLFWNPYQEVDALRDEYLRRAYRQAAPAMRVYYAKLRQAWYDDPLPSAYNDNMYKSAAHYIVGKGLEAACRAALDQAAATADTPKVAALVANQQARFDDWMAQAALQQRPQVNVPYLAAAETALTPAHPLWQKGAQIGDFKVMGQPEQAAAQPTTLRLLHDRKHLYLLFVCADDDVGGLYAKPLDSSREFWPGGDHIEVFLDGDQAGKGYYQFTADCNGNIWDARGFDNKWNSGWGVTSGRDAGGYWLLCRMPLADIGVNLSMGNRLQGLFYRAWNHNRGPGQSLHSTWGGGVVHQVAGFGDIILEME